eukprot:TRINITY_DN3062_c0_g1_i3.p1 TRINITY_DN3062_c0_g1~~TRINITY_DN3062_c0_g1_i3.p1  ORF type:complete len:443 (+),score=60.97 TRINITY_DN3062_c0_g1_i3:144-1472(+)
MSTNSLPVLETSYLISSSKNKNPSFIKRIRQSYLSVLIVVSFALFVDMFVYGIAIPILPSYAQKRYNANSFEIGLLFGSYAVGLFFAIPVFGFVSDKIGRRYPMLISMLGLATTTILFSLSTQFYQLIISRVAQGISAAGSWVVGLALIADVTPPANFTTNMGIAMGLTSVGYLIGPPIGGPLYEHTGFRIPFYLCAGLALLDFILRFTLINDHDIAIIAAEKKLNQTEGEQSSMIKLLKSRVVLMTIISVILSGCVLSALEPLLPLYLEATFNMSPTGVGLMMCAVVVPNFIASFLVGWLCQKIGNANVCILGAFLTAVSLVPISLPKNGHFGIELVGLTLAVFGSAFNFMINPTLEILAKVVDKQGGGAYAQAYALYNLGFAIGMMCGPPLGGLLYNKVGFFWTTVALAGILILFLPFGFFMREKEKKENEKLIVKEEIS